MSKSDFVHVYPITGSIPPIYGSIVVGFVTAYATNFSGVNYWISFILAGLAHCIILLILHYKFRL